jgi:hypothetical protein
LEVGVDLDLYRTYDGVKLKALHGYRLQIGCLNVGFLSMRSREVTELAGLLLYSKIEMEG